MLQLGDGGGVGGWAPARTLSRGVGVGADGDCGKWVARRGPGRRIGVADGASGSEERTARWGGIISFSKLLIIGKIL